MLCNLERINLKYQNSSEKNVIKTLVDVINSIAGLTTKLNKAVASDERTPVYGPIVRLRASNIREYLRAAPEVPEIWKMLSYCHFLKSTAESLGLNKENDPIQQFRDCKKSLRQQQAIPDPVVDGFEKLLNELTILKDSLNSRQQLNPTRVVEGLIDSLSTKFREDYDPREPTQFINDVLNMLTNTSNDTILKKHATTVGAILNFQTNSVKTIQRIANEFKTLNIPIASPSIDSVPSTDSVPSAPPKRH
jgi:hypothetical protein